MRQLNKKREIMGNARRGSYIIDLGFHSDGAALDDDYGNPYMYDSTEDTMRLY